MPENRALNSQPEKPKTTPETNPEDYIHIPISRRKFLGIVGLGAASVATGGILGKLGIFNPFGNHAENPKPTPTPSPSPSESTEPTTQPSASASEEVTEAPTSGETFILGEKTDLKISEFGLKWTPDGHISYFTTPEGKKRYFISAANSTWIIDTPGQKSLKKYIAGGELTQENFQEVLKPYNSKAEFNPEGDYKNGYTGITSVFQLDKNNNPGHLLATTHYEQRDTVDDTDKLTASVGLVESFDFGLTWADRGPIIQGRAPIAPGQKFSGAGQPSGIMKDGYLHVTYLEWNTGADQLYSAKFKVNSDGTIGDAEYVVDADKNLKPVIPVPDGAGYAAVPSISYNKDLGKYVCVFLTNIGFFEAVSDDLENYSTPKLIFPFDASNNTAPEGTQLKEGQEYIYYPSFLSDASEPDDHTTTKTGEIYYSSKLIGTNGDGEHNLKAVDVTIKS